MKIKKAPQKPIAATSLEKTARFYRDVLSLDPTQETETIIEIEEKITFHKEPAWISYIKEKERRIKKGNRTTEILLESSSLEEFIRKSQNDPEIRVITPGHRRKKQAIKLFDPDNHIIEVIGKPLI